MIGTSSGNLWECTPSAPSRNGKSHTLARRALSAIGNANAPPHASSSHCRRAGGSEVRRMCAVMTRMRTRSSSPQAMVWCRKSPDRDDWPKWVQSRLDGRLRPMQTTRIKRESPGTAALLGVDGLVSRMAEGAWWCRQSAANPSPPNSLLNREKTGNFRRITP